MSCCCPRVGTSMWRFRKARMSRTMVRSLQLRRRYARSSGEKPSLIAGFDGHTHQTSAAQGFESLVHPDLEVLLAGVQGEQHRNLLTAFEGFAGGFVGSNHQELDLPQ